jgi:hypothetical protein
LTVSRSRANQAESPLDFAVKLKTLFQPAQINQQVFDDLVSVGVFASAFATFHRVDRLLHQTSESARAALGENHRNDIAGRSPLEGSRLRPFQSRTPRPNMSVARIDRPTRLLRRHIVRGAWPRLDRFDVGRVGPLLSTGSDVVRSINFARPKSRTLTIPSRRTITFPGDVAMNDSSFMCRCSALAFQWLYRAPSPYHRPVDHLAGARSLHPQTQ